jgi:4-diphosphocytidyl-2-C-methyl-D-erythritol kinase
MMHAIAPAKLTLYLHVVGKRADGFHLLDSLVVFADFGDALSVEKSDVLSLEISGEWAAGLNANDNLVLRAARAMQSHFKVQQGAAFSLDKRIPVAAGLGGGSSDAATAMRMLNTLWEIHAPLETLAEIAAPLGADMTACIYQKPLRMQGIGEQINLLEMQDAPQGHLLLVNPRAEVLTAAVYQQCSFAQKREPSTLPDWRVAKSDLQAAAISICPHIEEILALLGQQTHCQVARLCGSGATCFGWFETADAALAAKATIAQARPDWWLQEAQLL